MPQGTIIKSGALVVLVNDEVVQRTKIELWLKEEGFEVQPFDSAAAALEGMDKAAPPDIIITDLFMPGIDGWRFCRLLKSPEFRAFNHVPVLIASVTYSGDDAARITEDLGADLFLPLPAAHDLFIDSVKSLLRKDRPVIKPKALIVDDSRTLTALLKSVFDAYGYETICAYSGAGALTLIKELWIDVVVLDYHLPDMTGEDLLILGKKHLPEAAYIMMTADSDPKLALTWMKLGASWYIKKPFDPKYLIELCVKARREQALLRVEALLEERTRRLQESEEKYKTLFRELQHRVKNSLAHRPPLPDNFTMHGSSGMGLELVSILTEQLEGSFEFEKEPETLFRLILQL